MTACSTSIPLRSRASIALAIGSCQVNVRVRSPLSLMRARVAQWVAWCN